MFLANQNYFYFIRKVKELNKDLYFQSGLFLKIILIIFITPNISSNLFLPFVKSGINNISFDHWTYYLNSGGDPRSFPYGLIMLLAYSPLSFLGNFFDKYIIDINLFELGFKFTSLCFDYLLLLSLSFLTNCKSDRLLIICYWLSPIAIYTNFIHGQLDIVPISLLILSICYLKSNKFAYSGLFLAFSIASKLSMLISLPFILIYIYKRRGLQYQFFRYLIVFISVSIILIIPYLSSQGYVEMVLNTKELERLYTVFIDYGTELKLYIVPVVYIFSLYLFWRLSKITQDLFLVSVGIGFLSILVFLPPALGWTLWIIPFLTYYQIISGKDIFLISFIYNFLYIVNAVYYTNQFNFDFLPYFELLNDSSKFRITNIFFTIQQCFGLLLAIRMYIYGLKRNNFYSTSNNPILLSIKGNHSKNIYLIINSLRDLIYKKDINFFSTELIINEEENNDQNNLNELSSFYSGVNKKDNEVIYDANYISESISKVEKELFYTNKPYQVLYNNSSLDLNLLSRKVNLKLNINNFEKNFVDQIRFEDLKKLNLYFDFKSLNIKNSEGEKGYSLVTYFPLGFLHNKLFNLFISISSLNVDIELINNRRVVKMEIEGFPSKEDIGIIASSLIPEIGDLSLNENGWKEGYIGIIQIILIANVSSILKNRTF